MSLAGGGPAGALANVLQGYPASDEDAGNQWASAYKGWAANAVAPGGAPLASSLPDVSSQIASGFSSRSAQGAAAGIAAALVGFWMAPPKTFVGGWVVTAAPGGAAMSSGLSSAFTAARDGRSSAAQAAQAIAAVLDAFTRTVIVTRPSPPAVGPIS